MNRRNLNTELWNLQEEDAMGKELQKPEIHVLREGRAEEVEK